MSYLPALFGASTLGLGLPALGDRIRNLKRCVRPAQLFTRQRNFRLAERGTVRRLLALLVRRTKPDEGLAADQRRLATAGTGDVERLLDRFRLVAIDVAHDVPAVGFEACRRVVAEPAPDFTVDRNIVVVVQPHQLVEDEHTGPRDGLVRDAFPQTAIAGEHEGVLIHKSESLP